MTVAMSMVPWVAPESIGWIEVYTGLLPVKRAMPSCRSATSKAMSAKSMPASGTYVPLPYIGSVANDAGAVEKPVAADVSGMFVAHSKPKIVPAATSADIFVSL